VDDDELRDMVSGLHVRVALLERVVYGAVAVMLAAQVVALVVLVTRLPH